MLVMWIQKIVWKLVSFFFFMFSDGVIESSELQLNPSDKGRRTKNIGQRIKRKKLDKRLDEELGGRLNGKSDSFSSDYLSDPWSNLSSNSSPNPWPNPLSKPLCNLLSIPSSISSSNLTKYDGAEFSLKPGVPVLNNPVFLMCFIPGKVKVQVESYCKL